MEAVTAFKCLGTGIRCNAGLRNQVLKGRFEEAALEAARVEWLPLPMGAKAQLLAGLACQGCLYGVQVGGVPERAMLLLRNACLKALWGTTRRLRCRELVFTLLVQGHRVDPQQALVYNCLVLFSKMMRKPGVREQAELAWTPVRQSGADDVAGPITTLMGIMQQLG